MCIKKNKGFYDLRWWFRRWDVLRIFHSDPDREKEKKRGAREGRERPMEVAVVTPEKLNLGINHGISIPLPTFLAASARRIGDSSCDAAITSLAGIKIQLYIKLSYIAPYLYLSRWYFLRFLPNTPRASLAPFLSVLVTLQSPPLYIHGVFRKPASY